MRNAILFVLFLSIGLLANSQNHTETSDKLNIEMIAVQGGAFTMGCTSEQGNDCWKDEKPVHRVTVSDFYIGKYEVTQAQWKAVMGNNPSHFEGDNLPVENVSWNDVQEFITTLNAQTGKQYRLPTEAEWEYAARGGNQSQRYKYSGSNIVADVAWYSESQPHEVGTKMPNELGIYDMSGNVWEWCNCWFGSYKRSAKTNPHGTSSTARVARGGSWLDNAWYARVTYRYIGAPDYRCGSIGFRLVHD